MIQEQDEIIIYKKDGTPIDVTDYVTSFSMNKGSLEGLGDGYTSTPIVTASCTLKNTNEMQFSPFQKKGMIVYEKYNFTGDGKRVYDNPIQYLKDVRCTNPLLTCSYSEGKLIFSEHVSGAVELFIARVDISSNNPLNFINGEYEPFAGAGSQITWKRNVYEKIDYYRSKYSNLTNKLLFYVPESKFVANLNLIKSGIYSGRTMFEARKNTMYNERRLTMFEARNTKFEQETELSIQSWQELDGMIEVTFDRILLENEVVNIHFEVRKNQKNFFYLDGVIGELVESETDVNQVTFSIKDKSYFLQDKFVSTDTFRNYHSFSDDENIIHILEEEQNGVGVVEGAGESTITGIDTNFSKYSIGQTVYLYKGQDYLESTIKSITDDETMTINEEIETETYNIYAEVQNSLENHIAKCLEDVADSNIGTFTLIAEDESNWRVIPKLGEQQYASVWDYLQSTTLGRAMFLGFKYQEILQQHVLTLKEIPETFEVIPKYVITDNDIINSSSYSSTSERIRTAWKLTYYNSETKQYETYIDDDFTQGNTVAISSNKKKIITSESLSVGKYVRINNEYRIVKQILSATEYIVNVPFSESGSFDIYLQGPYTNKYGLIPALIEIDNTSSIDTLEEAQLFLSKIKPQFRSVYETYTIAVKFNKFCELDNFDTIEIDSAVLSLFNEKMFVNNLQIMKKGGQWIAVFECSKQADIGEQKYTRIITEKGLNKINKDDNLNTQNIFEAPTNLLAGTPFIDETNEFSIYANVTWNNYIDKAVSWELDYKLQSENWDVSQGVTPTSNQQKILLDSFSIYDIRVRGVSKTGRRGEWAYKTVDNTNTGSISDIATITASAPYIDTDNDFTMYTNVSWSAYTEQVTWELEYKKQSETWTTARQLKPTSNSLKIEIPEFSIYNIRVRATNNLGRQTNWRTVDVDNTSTGDVTAITNLDSTFPAIDTDNNFSIFSVISWDSIQNVFYEMQVKKSTETWDNARSYSPSANSIRIEIPEFVTYNVRVRAYNRLGKYNDWVQEDIDNTGTGDLPNITSFVANSPVIDTDNDFTIYTNLSWDNQSNVSWELEYKKSTEGWEVARTLNPVSNSIKVEIPEFEVYNFRLRAYNRLGKYSSYTSTSLDNTSTGDISSVTNFVSGTITLDETNNKSLYSIVSWDDKTNVSWELDYKKDSDDWTNAKSIKPSINSQKITLDEFQIYDVRIRAYNRLGKYSAYSFTEIDNTNSANWNKPTNLTASEVFVDETNDFTMYTNVSWSLFLSEYNNPNFSFMYYVRQMTMYDFRRMTMYNARKNQKINWQIQYKKRSDSWTQARTIYTDKYSEKLVLEDFDIYDIRVKGTNLFENESDYAYTEVDNRFTGQLADIEYFNYTELAVDRTEGYNVYSNLTWKGYTQPVTWEMQIKKEGQTWDNAESKSPSNVQEKVFITENAIYNIRIRAKNNLGRYSDWKEISIDATKFLVENPIQNRTWYVRLFFENDVEEYFTSFDLINYTQNELNEKMDTIEIIPNVSTSGENIVILSNRIQSTPVVIEEGIVSNIRNRLGQTNAESKNLTLRPVENGYYYLINIPFYTDYFNNIDGVVADTKIKGENTSFCFFGTTDIRKKYVKNFTIEGFQTAILGNNPNIFSHQTYVENIKTENCSTGINGMARVIKCTINNCSFGIRNSIGLQDNVVDGFDYAYYNCNDMKNNRSTNGSGVGQKYFDCYASESNDPTYAIASGGSDTANGGFNT